jgi:hypothetical protein
LYQLDCRAQSRVHLFVRANGAADREFPAAADGWDVVIFMAVSIVGAGYGSAGEEAPGFAVDFEASVAAGVGAEMESRAGNDGVDGDDVPDVFGDDVGDEEVDFVGGVEGAIAAGADVITRSVEAGGALDLDAVEAVAVVDKEVVAVVFAPGLGHGKIEAGGFGEEGGFDGVSEAAFGRLGDGFEISDGDVEVLLGLVLFVADHTCEGAAADSTSGKTGQKWAPDLRPGLLFLDL